MSGKISEGTMAFVMSKPLEWPHPTLQRLGPFLKEGGGGTLDRSNAIELHTDGHVSLVQEMVDGGILPPVEFSKLRFTGEGSLAVVLRWRGRACDLVINGVKIGPYESNGDPIEIECKQFSKVSGGVSSLEDPRSPSVCQPWIDKRKKKFDTPKVRSNRRVKTISEEARDLYNAVENLKLFVDAIGKQGRSTLVGYLAAELRALVHWEKPDQRENGYNPLLLRMASKIDLPLPVFGSGLVLDQKNQLSEGRVFAQTSLVASCFQQHAFETLMDLQDWLPMPVTTLQDPSGKMVNLSTKDLITETANTLGVAHYDEDISPTVSILSETKLLQTTGLADHLCRTAWLVANLGTWILNVMDSKGLISLKDLAREKASPAPTNTSPR